MGGGTWSSSTYDAAESYRTAHNIPAFAYNDSGAKTTHDTLKPAGLDGKGAVRESRDSADHPLSVPIAVFLDVTGSMAQVPKKVLDALPRLLGLLLRKAYVTDPQIMFGAIGDATTDRAPLQVGQFESDNRMDDDLTKLLLEGGGGGQKTESYELAMYFMARRVLTDAWAKRGKRGYMFIIGDEKSYPEVKPREVAEIIGDTIQAPIPVADILEEVQQRWDVYYILPEGASYVGNTEILGFWRNLLTQNVIELADLGALCETIALTVGLGEGTTDLGSGLDDLADVGSSAGGVVGKALATIGSGSSGGRVVAAPLPGDLDTPSGNTRL